VPRNAPKPKRRPGGPAAPRPGRSLAGTGWLRLLVLALLAFAFLTPLLWMVLASLKSQTEFTADTLLPAAPSLDSYERILGLQATDENEAPPFNFPLYARNTLIIATLSLVGMVISSAIAAYGFARLSFPGRNVMFGVCLATMMIPFPVLMVPAYMIFKQLGWIGTFLPLWVPAWFGSAFNIFLLRQFFLAIPRELEESAMLDGASRWACFWYIIMPLSKPALAVVALFHFLYVWNDLIGPLIYLNHEEEFTLALGLQSLQSKAGDTPWNQMMAAATLIAVPVIVLFFFAQRTFIRGISTSGLKG
jgi:multiple sugar transport system permease protein